MCFKCTYKKCGIPANNCHHKVQGGSTQHEVMSLMDMVVICWLWMGACVLVNVTCIMTSHAIWLWHVHVPIEKSCHRCDFVVNVCHLRWSLFSLSAVAMSTSHSAPVVTGRPLLHLSSRKQGLRFKTSVVALLPSVSMPQNSPPVKRYNYNTALCGDTCLMHVA